MLWSFRVGLCLDAAVMSIFVLYVAAVDPIPTPSPNPSTELQAENVSGAAAMGALYPDGSPAVLWMNYTGSPGWVISLSGGGWRFLSQTASTEVPPPLYSDGLDPLTVEAGGNELCYGSCDGIMSNDPDINPLFHSFNKVWVPISGTSFTGDRTTDKPYPVRGARILGAVIAHLQTHRNMRAASDIILTGGSSGGLATYLVCDRVAALVAAQNLTTRYSCLADAGFFLDHDSMSGAPSQSPSFKESFYAWNSTGALAV